MQTINAIYQGLYDRAINTAARMEERYNRTERANDGQYNAELQKLQDSRRRWIEHYRAKAAEYKIKMI